MDAHQTLFTKQQKEQLELLKTKQKLEQENVRNKTVDAMFTKIMETRKEFIEKSINEIITEATKKNAETPETLEFACDFKFFVTSSDALKLGRFSELKCKHSRECLSWSLTTETELVEYLGKFFVVFLCRFADPRSKNPAYSPFLSLQKMGLNEVKKEVGIWRPVKNVASVLQNYHPGLEEFFLETKLQAALATYNEFNVPVKNLNQKQLMHIQRFIETEYVLKSKELSKLTPMDEFIETGKVKRDKSFKDNELCLLVMLKIHRHGMRKMQDQLKKMKQRHVNGANPIAPCNGTYIWDPYKLTGITYDQFLQTHRNAITKAQQFGKSQLVLREKHYAAFLKIANAWKSPVPNFNEIHQLTDEYDRITEEINHWHDIWEGFDKEILN